jgi:hypothetical protein
MTPARIEAAARAVYRSKLFSGNVAWEDLSEGHRSNLMVEATGYLAAAYPELANGTAWLAPMDPTPRHDGRDGR